MLRIEDAPQVTAEQAISILEKHTNRHGIIFDLTRMLTYQAYFIEKSRPLREEFRTMAGNSSLVETQRDEVIKVLTGRFQLPERKLLEKGAKSIKAVVVTRLLEDPEVGEDIKHFLQLLSELRSNSHRISYLQTYCELPVLKAESFEGHRCVLAKPIWKKLTTSRISASDPSVQNIYRDFGDIITHLPGQILVRADSAQIEPRIIYSHFVRDDVIKSYIEMYDDAYAGVYHFLFYTDNEIHPMDKAERDKLKTVMNATNYGGSLPNVDPAIAGPFKSKIQQHPKRLEWVAQVEKEVRQGADVFYSAFGTPVKPEETNVYKKGDPNWKDHMVRCGVNNPVQTTASDLMCQGVYSADTLIEALSRRRQTFIGYSKHDEFLYYVDEADESLIDALAGCVAYSVRDWIPIKSELSIGPKRGYDMT